MILNCLAASLSIHWLRKINAAITIMLQPKQAAATHLELGVTTISNKIANSLALCFCAASLHYAHWFMRERWLWHMLLPRLDSDFYLGDALQNRKQLFFSRLLLMTEYFIMRECENILSGYLCVVTTVFSQQDRISIFKFPKRFLEISCRDLTSFTSLSNLSN